MQDSRSPPTPHIAKAPGDEVGVAGNGVASESSELKRGGLHGIAASGAGGGAPVGGQIDAAVAADLHAQDAAPSPKNMAPAPEPIAKAFPESWREDLAGSDRAFRKTLDRFESPAALA